MNTYLQKRYLAGSWDEIVSRIISGRILMRHPYYPAPIDYLARIEQNLHHKTFIPAGNTLTYSNDSTRENVKLLRPNCAIQHEISEVDAIWLWKKGIGFGTCMLNENKNPVDLIRKLQDYWNETDLEHRPKRGNMFVYPWNGKYIQEFIELKSTVERANKIPAFNVSVSFNGKDTLDKKKKQIIEKISEATYNTGDPGIILLDRLNNNLPLINSSRSIKTVVPCGEQGMYNGEYCTLGSINLNSNELFEKCDQTISFKKLEQVVRDAVRFLDNVVSVIEYETKENSLYRRIGLGIMGFADYLDLHSIPYESKESQELARRLSLFIGAIARHESMMLAVYRGSFPGWNLESFHASNEFVQKDMKTLGTYNEHYATQVYRYRHLFGMRNVSVTCIPPTGGITLLTNNEATSIEPRFDQSIRLKPEDHLNVLSAWQEGMCNSVSKTINIHKNTSIQGIYDIYSSIFTKPFIKSLSIYRDTSRGVFQPIK